MVQAWKSLSPGILERWLNGWVQSLRWFASLCSDKKADERSKSAIFPLSKHLFAN
jgi:hypothetical protein